MNVHRCHKFGEMNIISGEVEYAMAETCRLDDTRCGRNATHFEEKLNTHVVDLAV